MQLRFRISTRGTGRWKYRQAFFANASILVLRGLMGQTESVWPNPLHAAISLGSPKLVFNGLGCSTNWNRWRSSQRFMPSFLVARSARCLFTMHFVTNETPSSAADGPQVPRAFFAGWMIAPIH